MKQLLIIFLLFTGIAGHAQNPVQEHMRLLEESLVTKDTGALNKLLHEKLSFGHSNGWVESKKEVIGDLLSGKLVYNTIVSKDISFEEQDDVTIVRTQSRIKYVLDGKEGELRLHVMLVWVKNDGRWQLMGRQSTKIN